MGIDMEGGNLQQPKPIPSKLKKRDTWIIITVIIVCVILLSTMIVVLGSKYELKIHIVSTTYVGLIIINIDENTMFSGWITGGEEMVETFVLYRGNHDILVHSPFFSQETTVWLNSDESITFHI